MKFVADASAILAVVLNESDAAQFLNTMKNASTVWISVLNWWEVNTRARTVLGTHAEKVLEEFQQIVTLEVEPVTREQADAAAETFAKFKGRPHRLNMGDSFAHSLAVAKRAPLLYKGDEFHNTGVETA
ncbi:MAG: type II toxin-antitoxin system VapC family toxin [Bryobacteraceae bacterium]